MRLLAAVAVGLLWYCFCVALGRPYDDLTEALCVASAAAGAWGVYRIQTA